VNLTFLSQRKTKETGCLLLKISKFATYLSSGKRGIHIRRSKIHLKEGQKTLDKFEIIRKLETIRTQLTNIKTNCKLVISDYEY
jgi:hypothetical protein